MESNWQYKSLESLENKVWDSPEFESQLVLRCHKLRKIPLIEYEIEDIRLMISQRIGLIYLIPLAIEKLEENVLVEGDLYEGDLLEAVGKVDQKFWEDNPNLKTAFHELLDRNKELLNDKQLKFTK